MKGLSRSEYLSLSIGAIEVTISGYHWVKISSTKWRCVKTPRTPDDFLNRLYDDASDNSNSYLTSTFIYPFISYYEAIL